MLVTDKKLKLFADGILEVVQANHHNVSMLQEALTHLGSAVTDMNSLLQLQEARIELLESDKSKRYEELTEKNSV